ncbi:MAG: dihydroorotase [Acidobacteriota bacterium]|nr:dihydroorotase [Acidobacteriota bacterium]
MNELLILGGRIVDPATGTEDLRDLLIQGRTIAAVEPPGALLDAQRRLPPERRIDAAGLVIAPGLIDVHVHLREPGQTHKETIATGTSAAAAGGFTTVVAMPNTSPVNDSVRSLQWMLDPGRGSVIQLLAMPAATRGSMGREPTDFEALVQAGAVGFTDDGKPILEDDMMRAALLASARTGVPLSQHAEDTHLTGATAGSHACSMNAGTLAFRLGLRGMSVEAESRIVERDIRLLREIERSEGLRPHLHVQHVSTARALSAIRAARTEGLHVTCEVAPHHFALTEQAVSGPGGSEYNTNAKMNPPLRGESDRQAVLAALLEGAVDCIATDHAPHASWEKEVEFERAPNGITGLETALGLALRVLHRERGMPLLRVLALLSTGPARIIGFTDRGTLRTGSRADLTLLDPADQWSFRAAESRSRSRNTPFDGAPMLGRVHVTICDGRIVFEKRLRLTPAP